MKDLNEVAKYIQENLKPREMNVCLDKAIVQPEVTGNVFYPLSGADGIALEVFPNAKTLVYVEGQSFKSTNGNDFTYFNQELFQDLYEKVNDSNFFQSVGWMGYGYDFSDVYWMYSRADILPFKCNYGWEELGLSTLLLARLRIVYKADILKITEELENKIYKIDLVHNNMKKSLYYICHELKGDSLQAKEIIWLKDQFNFNALLVKGFPVDSKDELIDLRKAIADIISDDVKRDPKGFTVVSDASMTGPTASFFNAVEYKNAGFKTLKLTEEFGYGDQALVGTGALLLTKSPIGAPFYLNIKDIYSRSNAIRAPQIECNPSSTYENSDHAKFTRSEKQPTAKFDKITYLDKINIGINAGNTIFHY